MTVKFLTKVFAASVALGLVTLVTPHTAKAQSRGTLQVSATVIETKSSFEALDAVKDHLAQLVNPGEARRNTVSTVAQISMAKDLETRTLVFTVDYSKN